MIDATLRVSRKFCRSVQSDTHQLELLHQSIEDQMATAHELIRVACAILEHAQLTRKLLNAVQSSSTEEFG
jgi:hypothetical protein